MRIHTSKFPVILLIIFTISCNNKSEVVEKEKKYRRTSLLKIFTLDSIVNNQVAIYKYGVYIELPKDTSGVSKSVLLHLKDIEKDHHKENDAIHMWIFTDSTVIPKHFFGDWTTKEIESKCFAHAAKYVKGYYRYHFNLLEGYKSE